MPKKRKPPVKEAGDLYRRFFKLEPSQSDNPNKGYIPSHMREGFDKAKIIQVPPITKEDWKI